MVMPNNMLLTTLIIPILNLQHYLKLCDAITIKRECDISSSKIIYVL